MLPLSMLSYFAVSCDVLSRMAIENQCKYFSEAQEIASCARYLCQKKYDDLNHGETTFFHIIFCNDIQKNFLELCSTLKKMQQERAFDIISSALASWEMILKACASDYEGTISQARFTPVWACALCGAPWAEGEEACGLCDATNEQRRLRIV